MKKEFFEPPTRSGEIDSAELEFISQQIDKDHQIAVLERALKLACETFCSGSHPEMRFEIEKFTLIKGVEKYFKTKAESDIKNERE